MIRAMVRDKMEEEMSIVKNSFESSFFFQRICCQLS